MRMPENRFKSRMAAGEVQFGMWVASRDSAQVEMLAGCGYDWLTLDCEHSSLEVVDVMHHLQAMAPYPTQAVVRAGWNDKVQIKRLLDVGAQTVLVPYVESVEEAEAAVSAMHYPPRGVRGVAALVRASRFGEVGGYVAGAGEGICLLVQVETARALDRLDDIAAVEGVDGVFIGPADLSASLGYPGEAGHPEVRKAVMDALRRIRAAGKGAGFLALDEDYLREALDAGASFLAIDTDTSALRRAAVARRAAFA